MSNAVPDTHIKRLVMPVYLPMMLLSAGMSAPAASFPQHLAALGATVGVVGAILSLRGMGNLITDLPGGLLIGRTRLRPVMATTLALTSVTGIVMASTDSVAVIGLMVLLGGVTSSFVITAMMTYVRVSIPTQRRGRALSLVGGSLRIGAVIGPYVGGLLADAFGAPSTFLLRSAFQFSAFLVFLASPDRGIGVPSAGVTSRGFKDQMQAVAHGLKGRWKALGTVGFAILMLMLMRASRNLVLPLWGDRIGLSATLIGTVMSIGAAIELVLVIPAGIIMDHGGRKVAASLCIGLFAIGLAMIPFSSTMVLFIVASLLIGIGNGFGAGINMTIGTDLAPEGAVSEFLGLWRFFGDIGQTSGPAIVGGLAAAAGLGVSVLVVAGLGGVGLLVLWLFAPETLRLGQQSE